MRCLAVSGYLILIASAPEEFSQRWQTHDDDCCLEVQRNHSFIRVGAIRESLKRSDPFAAGLAQAGVHVFPRPQ